MLMHGDLPYVEYDGEFYMIDTRASSGDLRFTMGHTSEQGVTLRHISIRNNAASAVVSSTNIDGGSSGPSNVFVVTLNRVDSSYTSDYTYSK